MEALRTLRAVPGVIAPVRLSLILLACGGTCYTAVMTAIVVKVLTSWRALVVIVMTAGVRTVVKS